MGHGMLGIRKLDHVRLFVNNTLTAARWLETELGFVVTARHGLTTGLRHESDVLIVRGAVTLLLTAPTMPGHELSEALASHGDFVQDVAFEVDDVDGAFAKALDTGAKPCREPYELAGREGSVRLASIHGPGDLVHTFLSRDTLKEGFLPGFAESESIERDEDFEVAEIGLSLQNEDESRWANHCSLFANTPLVLEQARNVQFTTCHGGSGVSHIGFKTRSGKTGRWQWSDRPTLTVEIAQYG